MKNSKELLFAAFFLGVTSISAMADEGKMYGAFDIGQGTAKDACTGLPATVSCKDTVMAYRLGLGYQINSNIAVEGSYQPSAKVTISGTYLGFPITGNYSMSTTQLGVIGSYPITDGFSLLGKAGMALIDAKSEATITGVGSAATSNNNTNFAYGLGVQFAINKQLSVRAMYEDYGSVKSSSTATGGNVSYLSAGLKVGF